MKYLTLSLIALATSCFAHEKELSLRDIGDALSSVNELSSIIVKINPGDELPFQFRLSGDVLQLENAPEHGRIKAIQPLYIKVEPQFLFSQNKKDWKSFESFFTGELGVSAGTKDNLSGEIHLDLHKR